VDVGDIFVSSTISNQPVVHCWIYHCECKMWVFLYVICIVNGSTRSTQTMTQRSDSIVLDGSGPYFLHTGFSFVIWEIWQEELKQSMFNTLCKIRTCHDFLHSLFCNLYIPDEVNIFIAPRCFSLSYASTVISWLLPVIWRSKLFELAMLIWYFWCCCFLILGEVLIIIILESSGH
jgi:hypothetical protein